MQRSLIRNIKTIYGNDEGHHQFKKGDALSHINKMSDAYILTEDGKIKSYGPITDAPTDVDHVIDAQNGVVLPCWCDSHTHIVFAESREQEFVLRLNGKSYEEIANEGGGILNSARKLRKTSFEELYETAAHRLDRLIKKGTGAIEIKSGYGLDFESEIKMLRVIEKLKRDFPIPVKANFLAAHAIPAPFKINRQGYIDEILHKMLPYIAEHQLADYCDVFCDQGFFTVQETDQILKAAAKYGLKPKIHANELANSGGVQIGIKNNAISVDHLEQIGDEEIDALLESNTIPTVLPNCSFFLKIQYAPARKMIDHGLGICIATDYNPGSAPSGNMALAIAIACTQMKITPQEAINAATINGAHALELAHQCGSISKGKLANFIITKDIPSLDYIPYSFGEDLISNVIINGEIY